MKALPPVPGPIPSLVSVVALGIVLLAAPAPARAVEPPKNLRILDACVYDLYFQQRSSEDVARRCRCVVRQASDQISDREAQSYRVGSRATGSLRRKIYEALRSCR